MTVDGCSGKEWIWHFSPFFCRRKESSPLQRLLTEMNRQAKKETSRKSLKSTKPSKEPKVRVSTQQTTELVVKKTHRWRPGTVALREIRKYQSTTNTLISKASFRRLVHGIATSLKTTIRMRASALEALQEAAEAHMIEFIADANRCTSHGRRSTLYSSDTKLVLQLRGDRN
jgi:histone H3